MSQPEGLCEKGKLAYHTIIGVLRTADALDEVEDHTFYSPAEWKARGEQYGCDSLLVVVYDGGCLCDFFDPMSSFQPLSDGMDSALRSRGLFAEPCTNWYSAIYED